MRRYKPRLLGRGHRHGVRRPELTAAWKAAHELGIAGEVCDRIIARRPIPEQLLETLAATPAPAVQP